MQKLINLTLEKNDVVLHIKLPKNTLVNLINLQKIKKVKYAKINDVLIDSWIIINKYSIKNEDEKVEIKDNKIVITNTIKEFCNELDKLYPDSPWDMKNIRVKKICEIYNITNIQKIFIGLRIENRFGDIYYSSGALMSQDFFEQKISKVNTSKLKELKLV